MRKYLLILLSLLFLTVDAQFRHGFISDPDGYVNVRRTTSTRSAIERRIPDGASIFYIPEGNGWSAVYSDPGQNFMGYVHSSRIRPAHHRPEAPRNGGRIWATVSDPDGYTNIRAGQSTNSRVVWRVPSGKEVQVSRSGAWRKVWVDGEYRGYIHSSRLVY